MIPFNPEIHHRRSMRLQGYDYTQPGAYLITLVAYHRSCIFGTVNDGKIQLTPLGNIVHNEWMRSISIRNDICLYQDEFIVMPNHLHAIVWLVGADGVRPNSSDPGAYHAPQQEPQRGMNPHQTQAHCAVGADAVRPIPQRKPRSLSSFIAGFKSSVTSRAKHELEIIGIWQRNYYDHIIRNQTELENIWKYIDTNPLRWEDDQLHPSAVDNPFNKEN